MSVCHSVGVAAAPIFDEQDLFEDPHMAARNWFRSNHCEDVDPLLFPGHQWRWDGPELRWDQLNMMGRDNDYVYKTLLGKTDAEMAALDAERHLGSWISRRRRESSLRYWSNAPTAAVAETTLGP